MSRTIRLALVLSALYALTAHAAQAALTVDRLATKHQATFSPSITSPAFSTAQGGELLVAFVSSDGPAAFPQTFSAVTGGGLTWRLRQRTNFQAGDAEIWQAVASTRLTKVAVTATRAGGSFPGSITVASFIGADLSQDGATGTGAAAGGAPTASLTTTKAGSWVWAVGNDWDRAVARTVGAGQTKVDEYLASPVGDTFWVQRQTATTANAGTTVTINDTAPTTDRWNLSLLEIPAAGSAVDTTPPTTSITSPSNGATVSGTTTVTANAADNIGVVGVQFKLDGNNLGAEDTTSPYSVPWNTTTATDGSHQLTAVARDAAGNVTTSAVVTVIVNNGGGGGTPLTINGNQQFQTIDGWGVSANAGSWDGTELTPAIDKLVDAGSTIWRVVAEQADWEATNDDADPSTFNWTYYNSVYSSARFQKVWATMAYLNSKGITHDLMLNFMGKGPAWMMSDPSDPSNHTLNPAYEDEWVEMVVSAAYYARNTEHLQFGLFSPNNEEDWAPRVEGILMDPATYARAMNKVFTRLEALGMGDLHFVGPDTAQCVGMTTYRQAILQYPLLMSKLDDWAVHDYTGGTCDAQNQIAGTGKSFWLTEMGAFNQGMSQVGQGASALLPWDGYDSVYQHAILSGLGSAPGTDAGPSPALLSYDSTTHVYTPRKEYYQFAQLFKYVPKGSVRIGATEPSSDVTTLAFRDPVSARVTIVGQNLGSTDVTFSGTLSGLPELSSFEYYTTDNSVNMQRGSDVQVVNGRFTVVSPANGIFTLTHGSPADSVAPSAPTNLQAAGSIGAVSLSWSAATDNVGVTGYSVYRSTTPGFTPSIENRIGQTAATTFTDVGLTSGTYHYRVKAQDAAGNASAASEEASATVLADVEAPTVPTNLATTSVGSQTVSLSWNASTDNVATTGYRVYRDGTQIATTASTSYTDSTASPLTTYTYAVAAYDAAGNVSSQSSGISVTTTAAVAALAVDNVATTHQSSAGSTISSPAFSTAGGDRLLVAFIASDGPAAGGSQTISAVNGGGVTWTLRRRVNTQGGTSEIWTAVAPVQLSMAFITATRGSGSYVGSMTIVAFSGADTSGVGAVSGASASTGAPATSLVATRTGSWVWGVGNDWDRAIARTLPSGQDLVDQYLASVEDTFWVQRRSATSVAGTTVTLNATAPTTDRWNLASIEVLPKA
jgi:chitodextrinase